MLTMVSVRVDVVFALQMLVVVVMMGRKRKGFSEVVSHLS
jgi:hypothetical protein